MSGNNTNSGGIGFVGLLTLMFIFLKVSNVINWSWWWVLSPSLISLGFWFLVAFLFYFVKE